MIFLAQNGTDIDSELVELLLNQTRSTSIKSNF